jgi:hypothetical protein
MRSREIAVSLLVLFGGVSTAQADVSLTDQQTYAKGVRYGSSGAVVKPLAAGQVPRLIDATGLEWFVNDEVNYATESSAVGAASDAVFSGPVEATTAGGGAELSVLSDAFDGYNALEVTVGAGAPVFYNNVGAASSDCDGRQILMPAMTVGGVQVSRKLYVPADDGFARWVNTVSNTSGADQTVTLRMVSDLGSDAGTRIGMTSSGDTLATVIDDWITSYEAFVNQSSRTPRLAHVLQSPGASVRANAVTFVDGSDQVSWSYTLSVPAGGTSTVLNFAAGLGSRSDAAAKAAQLSALPPSTQVCLSATEKSSLINMLPTVIPSGPEPTGPAELFITSPTDASTYQATSPFLSLAGRAGPSLLNSITWTSNRGFNGETVGGSEWSIPNVRLLSGANVITVTATYDVGPPITDTITVNLGATSYLLPEGATGSFFTTDLLIANPNDVEVEVDVRFLKEDGTNVTLPLQELAPRSRTTINVNQVQGLEASSVSSLVTSPSGAPLVVERTMFWDATSYGSHGAAAIEGPRNRFLFGEGSQGSFFDTFFLLANTNIEPTNVSVQFYPENEPPVLQELVLQPNSRTTVYAGTIPELVNRAFSAAVNADLPIVAERAMYFGTPLFSGGHDSPGVGQASFKWFFAEGASGSFFDTFYLVGNAGTRTANLTMEYQLISGGTVTVNRQVPPFGRLTLNAALEAPELTDTSFALVITSDEPVTAERSMYWGRTATTPWYEAHNSFGTNETAMKWGLAEGRIGTDRGFQTFILIGNTEAEESKVRVTFLRTNGETVIKEYVVPEFSRFNLDVGGMVPELQNEEFGAIIQVLEGSPIFVERSLYSASGGVAFAAGTNSQAVRLP